MTATLLALAALIATPPADALVHADDITFPPPFVSPVELSDESRLQATVEGDAIVLHGHVRDELERFLVRRAIAARHGASTPVIDRVLVVPPRADAARATPVAERRELCTVDPGTGAAAHASPPSC